MVQEHALPAVVELRQYTLHPGRRDELIALFEREFIEPQQACGISLLGLFRDLADADRFVWLRGFAGMPARAQALADFYGGPVWRAHREAANATMVDSDNVLLLRPGAGLPGAVGASGAGRVLAWVWPLQAPADAALRACVSDRVLPMLAAAGATPLACLETEPASNNFPRLPVREGEQVLVLLATLPRDRPAPEADALSAPLNCWLRGEAQVLQLEATARSAWR